MKKFVDGLLNIFPLIAPIPTAWAIAEAMRIHLGWPLPVLIIAAVAIETLGLGAADTASKYYEFNRSARPGELKAPAWMAYLTNILYFGVTLTMTLIYEPMAALFPGLSGVGFFLFVLRKDYGTREQTRDAERARLEQERLAKEQKEEEERKAELAKLEQEKQERREERRKRREERKQALQPVVPVAESRRGTIGSDTDLLAYLRQFPGQSQQVIADHFGVSRSAVGQRIKKLKETGMLARQFEAAAKVERS